ncbi:MAG: PilT/PilU family type 4a pilus ATPase [Gammaproteobacteria bacterium]|nr:PilT/PilU family type 4a pilus ATPase [Gammaproteobacteria bacterium]MCP5459963.1 PilT/PilU family type 4a pilus ATPase [Gammaproteobacteria bacterium]
MDITPYLKLMVDKNASDLFFYVGAPVHIKIDGVVRAVGNKALMPGQPREIAYSVMKDDQIKEFEQEWELNFAIPLQGVGRFRANVFKQRGETSMVVRYIKGEIPQVEELGLPTLLRKLVMEKRGLILMVGATGSGKSTTLAAMIDHRNTSSPGHILTIEDPIEFTHQHKKSIIGQREIGIDTHDFENALRSAMREAPDVILIGEIRSREVMKYAMSYAETGHLCLSTLHSNNANGALERIVNFFPEDARAQLLMDLSLNLRAIVSQRLIRGLDGGLVPAVEVLLNTPYIADLIQKGKIDYVKDAMEQGTEGGMITFDQALFELYKNGKISKEEAIKNADSRNNVGLKIRLHEGMATNTRNDALSLNEEIDKGMML